MVKSSYVFFFFPNPSADNSHKVPMCSILVFPNDTYNSFVVFYNLVRGVNITAATKTFGRVSSSRFHLIFYEYRKNPSIYPPRFQPLYEVSR